MKRIIVFILIVMLFTTAIASCSKPSEETSSVVESNPHGITSTDPGSSEEPNESAESSAEESVEPIFNVEKKDYGGKEFVIYDTQEPKNYPSEIMENELSGDAVDFMTTNVNSAIAERNRLVEDHLGIKIREVYVTTSRWGGQALNDLRENSLSGDLGIHVAAPSIFELGTLAGEGCFVDLNSMEGFNANAPWFDQSFNKTVEVNGKLFFVQGDCGLYGFNATNVIYYNKKLASDYGLDLYKAVRDGDWTFDAVYTYAKLCSEDLNQDGKMDYNDKMGYCGQYDDSWSWFYGSGEKIVDIQNDKLVLTMYNERSAGVVDSMFNLFNDRDVYCCANDYFSISGTPVELTVKQFMDGRSLFFCDNLTCVHRFSEMTDGFGILPIPKYNKEQDSYYSMLNSYSGNAFAIPYILSESEQQFAAECLQAFFYYSTDTVKK